MPPYPLSLLRRSLPRVRLLGATAMLAALANLLQSGPVKTDSPAPAGRQPLYATTEPARNPAGLVLLADPTKVVGWVAGTKDRTGEAVTVRVGDKTEIVRVAEGNTFSWPYQVAKAAEATFTLGDLKRSVALQPIVKPKPSVFFVVDRSVYRPNQPLHFAGFLRELDERGEFVPLADRAVEVRLTAQKKGITVAKLKLTSDAAGRITGSYPFVDADPLDNYTLAVADFVGEAKVSLAEFRKSKIKLNITGERVGDKVKLRFSATDFLDQAVPGSKVQFTAQVVRDPARTAPVGELKSADFVYAADTAAGLRLEDLGEDEQLLARVQAESLPFVGSGGPRVVAQIEGTINLADKPTGEHVLDLPPTARQGRHAVVVQGVLTDANGREQRATRTVPLDDSESALKLSLAKTTFVPGEAIRVTARGTTAGGLKGSISLVAMRLSPAPAALADPYGFGLGFYGGNQFLQNSLDARWSPNGWNPYLSSSIYPYYYRGSRIRRPIWQPIPTEEPVRRTLATAVAFQGDAATLKLNEPGAYKLIAVLTRADQTEVRQEIGCVVQSRDDLPGLTLQLDRERFEAGDTLTGAVQSRYADARVLLTVRDSTGLRLWKTLQMKDGVADLKLALPAELRYGCVIDVQYADAPGKEPAHVASRYVQVRPTGRMLTVETKLKPVVEPGEKVAIDLQVNRAEAVDLIVSVYDQSLLGIKPDQSIDIRNFYLADERVRATQARDVLRRRLAGITVGTLLARAEKLLKAAKADDQTPEVRALRDLKTLADQGQLTRAQLVALLHLAGVKCRAEPLAWNHRQWVGPKPGERDPKGALARTALIDVLEAEPDGWRLHADMLHDTLFLTETHKSYPQGYAGYNPYAYQRAFGQMNYGGLNGYAASGNSFQSFVPSGQSFLSHLPAGPGVGSPALLVGDPDQGDLSVRRDFSDSAFWSAHVRTDATGKARVEFRVPDSLTNWQVVVTAVSKDMHIGRHTDRFQTFKPIMVWPMLPRVFTEGDTVRVFASVHNRTAARQTIRVRLKVENGTVLDRPEQQITLDPKTNGPVFWDFRAGASGFTQLLMSAACEAGSDASLKRLPVTPLSVPEVVTKSGFAKGIATIEVPEGVDPKSATLEVRFVPSLAADMADTLDYLVEYPYGCVEQTMSRFLPAIKVAQVLRQAKIEHHDLQKKLPECVNGGIKRLLELQQPDGGWGWNGTGQTHEMMTPYALYGLLQAEKAGYPLGSENAVNRGLARLEQFIVAMNEKQTADRIFCMYVYGHRHNLQPKWWEFIAERLAVKDGLSDYALALALEMAVQKQKAELAGDLAKKLRARAHEAQGNVFWKTAGFSRWGEDPFEVTAVALKALVAYDKDDALIPGVLNFFATTKRGNRWNSTKDTAMILCAVCDYLARQSADGKARPRASVRVNGGAVAEVDFDGKGLTKVVTVPADQLKAGANRLAFGDGSAGVMYRAVLRYRSVGKPAAAKSYGIEVTRRFWLLDDKGNRKQEVKAGDTVPRGSYLESQVEATSALGVEMRYVLVENPKPACCEVVPTDDPRFPRQLQGTPYVLREDRTAHVAYHHEQTPATLDDRCVLLAELAGDYLVPAARVELMYQTETQGHSGTFAFRVGP